jgi:hypothetical protein
MPSGPSAARERGSDYDRRNACSVHHRANASGRLHLPAPYPPSRSAVRKLLVVNAIRGPDRTVGAGAVVHDHAPLAIYRKAI